MRGEIGLMCKWGTSTIVRVKVQAELSHTGEERWADKGIDSCIASIVKALQDAGIDMRGSCCGHGKQDGEIVLSDGRTLVIKATHREERQERRTA